MIMNFNDCIFKPTLARFNLIPLFCAVKILKINQKEPLQPTQKGHSLCHKKHVLPNKAHCTLI